MCMLGSQWHSKDHPLQPYILFQEPRGCSAPEESGPSSAPTTGSQADRVSNRRLPGWPSRPAPREPAKEEGADSW